MLATKTKTNTTNHFIDPAYVIAQLEMKPGSTIADFGCGSGFFSIPLSAATGKEGIVHALDILPAALEAVESKARLLGIANIVTKRANLEVENGSGFKSESMDWIVIKDMLYQNKKKAVVLKEARRVLKPRGKALVIEWDEKNLAIGPDKKLRIASKEMDKLVKKQKFTLEKSVKLGNFHYGMIIAK
jgi:ubiquinone/menaquinone biosynthesis C-methylase UbiE